MSPRSKPARRRPRRSAPVPLALAVLACVAIAAAATVALLRTAPPADAGAAPAPVDGCRGLPAFVADPRLGIQGAAALATDQVEKGLVLLADAPARFQHPSWDDAGFLGPLAYDRAGNIYVAPTPRLSLADNPLAGATTIWRVDSASAELRPFATLPGAASERNPYGVLGLSYNCELEALYAGGVAGSTPGEERGGVVAVRLSDGAQTPLLQGVDVLGVLVVRRGDGYELYAGLARSPEVIVLPLDARGLPAGPARPLLDLTAAGAAPSERARKLRLVGDELLVELVPFNYSLQNSASNLPQSRRATYAYDRASGAWQVRQEATAGP
jgi:hypothetical protein